MMKRAVLLAVVLWSSAVLAAQSPGVRQFGNGMTLMTQGIRVSADSATLDERSGELIFAGTVQVAPAMRSGQVVPAVNEITIKADEADINGSTGEVELRGNVRMSDPRWIR